MVFCVSKKAVLNSRVLADTGCLHGIAGFKQTLVCSNPALYRAKRPRHTLKLFNFVYKDYY